MRKLKLMLVVFTTKFLAISCIRSYNKTLLLDDWNGAEYLAVGIP